MRAGLIALLLLPACAAESRESPRPPAPRTPRVLVCALAAGYEHDVATRAPDGGPALVERALAELGRASGAYEAVRAREPSAFDREALAGIDAVCFYTSGELPLAPAQRAALLARVREGAGFVGVHCAADTLYTWPEYGALLGGVFDGHPWHEEVRVRVEDRAHPATRALGAGFSITDEIYQFKEPYARERLRVLLSLDLSSVDAAAAGAKRTDGDYALAWCREEGAGRVFYTALGHRAEVWADERFRSHLLGGIRWALGAER
jgi:type 1 glutamine amidotransferase